MIRDDEQALRAAIEAGETPRAAGKRLGMASKRVCYLCGKWASRNTYEYGVCVDLGWVLPSRTVYPLITRTLTREAEALSAQAVVEAANEPSPLYDLLVAQQQRDTAEHVPSSTEESE